MKHLVSIISAIAATLLFVGCGSIKNVVNNGSGNGTFNAANILGNASIKTYTFNAIPQNVQELQALPEANMKDPYGVAALTMAALLRYETDPEACFEMLNWLKGPESLSSYERQFIRERLEGKTYKPRSFFQGATVANNYAPSKPYKIQPVYNPYTFQNANWATVYVRSFGADNPRTIKLRQKPSTGEWFLNEIQCLSDIREPASENPWY